MALSLSFPSSKSDSGQSIFKTEREDSSQANSAEVQHTNEMSEETNGKSQKPWKSAPSLNILNKTPAAAEDSSTKGVVKPSTSFIPVPTTRKSTDKVELTLENFINSNSDSGSVKGLPDVTESPQTPFSSDKPCDLLAQLEIVRKQREMETSGRESATGESDSVDDNGNPLAMDGIPQNELGQEMKPAKRQPEDEPLVDQKTDITKSCDKKSGEKSGNSGEILEKVGFDKSPEPKYFINAAALSEDNFELPPSPAPSPCSSHFSSLNYIDPYPSLCPFVPDRTVTTQPTGVSEKVNKGKEQTAGGTSQQKMPMTSTSPKENPPRPRVPVSKSFPDIVQTTFSNEDKEAHQLSSDKTTKDNSDTESLVADSLEDVRHICMEPSSGIAAMKVKDGAEERPLKAFEQPLPSYGFDPMTESQMGGISAEKPPEAWVIDFNSLSLESELMETSARERKSSMGSNPSSLAYFINLDEKSEASSSAKGVQEATPDKKIFTMFVDLGEKEGSDISQSQTKSSDSESLMSASMTGKRGLINKPVVNVMETSGLKYPMSRRFPSPIFQHRAAAEASRKAARMELTKERGRPKEQFLDSLEPQSAAFMGMGARNEGDPTMRGHPLIDSTSSNRSSLHVANVLDASFTSSLLSSMENSSPADIEVCQGGPCFKLGKDLLRMFQEGINTDVNIMVNGKCIKAHKCILASRSQYFAAILSGNWVENAGNTINLDGFSYTVVQFTMYHIYSGTNEIPDTIDLLELATFTDLLGLEGLRENISQTIRAKFCHNFHRPCTGCISGVIECFPIALAYGMDELHRKMTKWICKHFVRIWPTKAFANLGDELIEKCLRYSVNHLSVDNILDHTLGCDQLLTTMPTVRWTEPIFSIVGQLSEACVQYIGEHFCEVLQAEKFLLFGKGQTWNISRIEGTFMEALNLLKPDEACISHTALSRLIELGTETIDEVEWSTLFVDFLKMLRGEIERFLLANASKAVLSKGWEQLGQDVRKKICTSSFMGFDKYGNKIVKNQSSGAMGSGTAGHGPNTVPVQNVKPTTKERPSNYSSARQTAPKTLPKQVSVPVTSTIPREPNKEPILSPITTNPAKVASVRPMPAAKQNFSKPTANVPGNSSSTKPRSSSTSSTGTIVDTRENKTLGRLTSHNKPSTPPSLAHRSSGGSVPRKYTSVEREKSFNNSSRPPLSVATTSSANRTPLKPLTPSKTDSPLVQPGPSTGTIGRSGTSRRAAKSQPPQQPKPIPPPTKVFLTNSAKAAAVSKPTLRGSSNSTVSKRTPSSSATSLLSQQSVASSSKGNAAGAQQCATVPHRYLSLKDSKISTGGFSARSSFSNVERPLNPAKVKVVSNPPRRNTYSNATLPHTSSTVGNRNVCAIPSTSSGATMKRPLSGGGSGLAGVGIPSSANRNVTDAQNTFSKDNIMSRSTIETDSGETKMRTLAEIGRSSTFSKDEPTILGKLDSSTYSTLDMEVSP